MQNIFLSQTSSNLIKQLVILGIFTCLSFKTFSLFKIQQYARDYVLKLGFRVYPSFREYCNDQNVFKTLKQENKETKDDNDFDNGLILPSMMSSESEAGDQD